MPFHNIIMIEESKLIIMTKENNFNDLNDVFKSLAIIQAFIKRDMKALLDWLCESSGKW